MGRPLRSVESATTGTSFPTPLEMASYQDLRQGPRLDSEGETLRWVGRRAAVELNSRIVTRPEFPAGLERPGDEVAGAFTQVRT